MSTKKGSFSPYHRLVKDHFLWTPCIIYKKESCLKNLPICTITSLSWKNSNFYICGRCLDKDPARRWSCDQLLSHNYFKNFSFKMPESEGEELNNRRNGGFNSGGMLLPHLPHHGGSQNGSPDIRSEQEYSIILFVLVLGSHRIFLSGPHILKVMMR